MAAGIGRKSLWARRYRVAGVDPLRSLGRGTK